MRALRFPRTDGMLEVVMFAGVVTSIDAVEKFRWRARDMQAVIG